MAKPFINQLTLMRHGELSEELDDAIADVLSECKRLGKSGELVLKLKFKVGDAGQVEVFDDVIKKLPKPARGTSILFIGADNESLQKEDPRQRTLEGIKTIADRPTEVVDIRKAS